MNWSLAPKADAWMPWRGDVLRVTLLIQTASIVLSLVVCSAQLLGQGSPTASEVNAEIETLLADSTYEAVERAVLVKLKREILAKVEELDRITRAATKFEEEIAAAPARLAQLEKELRSAPGVLPKVDGLEGKALQEGEALAKVALSSAESRLAPFLQEEARRGLRRLELPEEIGEARAATESIVSLGEVDGVVAQAETARLSEMAREVSAARERLLVLERRHLDVTDPVIRAEIELAESQVGHFAAVLDAWTRAHEAERREKAGDLIARAVGLAEKFSGHPEFGPIADENLALARSRLERRGVHESSASAVQLVAELEENLDKLARQRVDAATRVRLLEAAGLTIDTTTGNVLRRERASLPSLAGLRTELRNGIIEATRAQIELIDLEDQFREIVPSSVEDPVAVLREFQREVLAALIDDRRRHIETLGTANSLRSRLVADLSAYTHFIDERVLWIRNGGTLSAKDLSGEVAALRKVFGEKVAGGVLSGLREDIVGLPFLWLVACGLIFLPFYYRSRLAAGLERAGEDAWRRNCTSIIPTLRAISHSLLLAVPMPLLLAFVAWRCGFGEQALKSGLMGLVVFLGLAMSASTLCRRRGLLECHLGMGKTRVMVLRRRLRWFTPVMLVPVFFTAALGAVKEEGTLGRVFFIVMMLIVAAFLGVVLRPRHRIVPAFTRFGWVPKIAFLAGVVTPLVLACGAWLGYLSSVELLSEHVFATILAGLAALLIYAFFGRLLLVSRRHLAIQQAIERQAARSRERERREESGELDQESDPLPSVEEVTAHAIDIATVKQQAQWLLRTGMILVFVIVLSGLWADLLPAVSALDRIALWGGGQAVSVADLPEAGGASPVAEVIGGVSPGVTPSSVRVSPVTLLDIFWAIVIFVLTLVFAKNVPAFIELAILPRLQLARGAGFAITTSVRYVIVIVGVFWAAGEVGITWNRIQWIAAAITLGIGFGLQEVVANFVAGIILLFERPMRLGDYITVGDLSGRVTRIEMRATTIRDFAHKELVIPNKEFITGQFVNWTLSDNVVRVSVAVGVAYGSDTELVRSTLLAVARGEARAMDEPPPQVVFLGFGSSSLDFELRVHIAGADEMVAARSDLHFAIDKAFRKAGIEIAFPQLDLHLKSKL